MKKSVHPFFDALSLHSYSSGFSTESLINELLTNRLIVRNKFLTRTTNTQRYELFCGYFTNYLFSRLSALSYELTLSLFK